MDDITLQQPSAPAGVPAPLPAGGPAGGPAANPATDQFHDAMSDPVFLRKAAVLALENGVPEGVAWLAHAHQAANENGVRAAQALIAGDGQRAVQLWNASGVHTDATGATKNEDGTWTVTRKSGAPVTINPEQEMASFLSPQAFLAQRTSQQKATAETAELGARAKYYNASADFQGARAGLEQDKVDMRREVEAAKDETRRTNAQLVANTKAATSGSKARPLDANQLYHDLTQKFISNPINGERPEESARRAVLASPDAVEARVQDDGTVVAFNRATGEPYEQFPNVEAFTKLTGRSYITGGPAPKAAKKEPGFFERNLPRIEGLTAPSAPPKPGDAPAKKGITVGDDVRRIKRFFTGDDEAQRTASGKIR